MARLPEGVFVRHRRRCGVRAGKHCTCKPAYQAMVYDRATRTRKSRTFPTASAARTWRQDTMAALRRGLFVPGRARTVRTAGEEWLVEAREGLIRNRSGDPYKPSTLRGYEQALRLRVYPAIGATPLADLRRSELQRLVTRWLKKGHLSSTVRNTLMPLRSIYRRALALDEIAVNPLAGVELPAVRGRRDRFASPVEAAALIAGAPARDRAIWATAMYAGLRRGELQALDARDVDLAAGIIRVRSGWDPKEGRIGPKSAAGVRTVPSPAALRPHLARQLMRVGRRPGLVFGRSARVPFNGTVEARARRAWEKAGLPAIGLHACRHTYASLMIAAGVNAKALATFMGHSSVQTTLDRYGHLMPGSEEEAAELLDTYLEAATA